ncbi:MAG: glucose-1-phosphate cytidylyltransferase [Verrucomicrobia bacterium]|nr:glucose-1-phosphate cytidylyltransferase [Verrucomicrobiota bacterium]
MKAIILAGGLGTRISEESHLKPKPLIEIGGRPILWHIMKIYSAYDVNDFIICAGYKGYLIKEYFFNYVLHNSDVLVDVAKRSVTTENTVAEPWFVRVTDTGLHTMTGGRIKRVGEHIDDGERFCLTYGDGVADIDVGALLESHVASGRLCTMTVVSPPGRFGSVDTDASGRIIGVREKPDGGGGRINGGFFVCESAVMDYIEDDDTVWEQGPLSRLAMEGQLNGYYHDGYWQPMDTLREKNVLENLWASNSAPWKMW